MRRLALLALLVPLTFGDAPPAHAAARCEVDRDSARCEAFGLSWRAPDGWELVAERAYPGVLLSARDRTTGARISVAAQRLARPTTQVELVEQSRKALRSAGFEVGARTPHATGAMVVALTSPRGQGLLQGYLLGDQAAFTVTLSVTTKNASAHTRAFDDALRRLSIPAAPATTDRRPTRDRVPTCDELLPRRDAIDRTAAAPTSDAAAPTASPVSP